MKQLPVPARDSRARPWSVRLLRAACALACSSCSVQRELPPDPALASSGVIELRVATYNVFLRPLDGVIAPIPPSDARCRADEIGEFLARPEQGYDLVALQEGFDGALLDRLVERAVQAYPQRTLQQPAACELGRAPYCTPINGGLSLLGGVRTRFAPALSEGFERCGGIDCLSNKGLLYVPVHVERQTSLGSARLGVNVLTTHLDAGARSAARTAQIEQLRALLDAAVCRDPVRRRWPTLVLGDFNVLHVGAGSPTGAELNAEYRRLLDTLAPSCLSAPRDVHAESFGDWPSDSDAAGTRVCRGNALSPCDRRFDPSGRIDYVFLLEPRPEPGVPRATVEVTSVRTRAVASPRCSVPSLSDHKLVEATLLVDHQHASDATSRSVLTRVFD